MRPGTLAQLKKSTKTLSLWQTLEGNHLGLVVSGDVVFVVATDPLPEEGMDDYVCVVNSNGLIGWAAVRHLQKLT